MPRIARIVAAQHVPMFLHEEDVRIRWMLCNVVNAVAHFRVRIGNVLRVQPLIDRFPRGAAVITAKRTGGGDSYIDPFAIRRVENDCVQAHAARAWLPLRSSPMAAQSGKFVPGLSAVGRTE